MDSLDIQPEVEAIYAEDHSILLDEGKETGLNLECSSDGDEVGTGVQAELQTSQNNEDGIVGVPSDDASESQAQVTLDIIGEPTFQKVHEMDVLLSLPDRYVDRC